MVFYNLNQRNLAPKMGISTSALNQIINGKTSPGRSTISSLLDSFPELNPDCLLDGKGQMLRSLPADTFKLPIAGRIAAGAPTAINDLEPLRYITLDSSRHGPPTDLIAFMVEGDSMAPLITHQDIVVCSRRFDLSAIQNKIAAIRVNGENTLKLIVLNQPAHPLILMPLNCRSIDPYL
jgi:SOS-response transcriptional repressor LexA